MNKKFIYIILLILLPLGLAYYFWPITEIEKEIPDNARLKADVLNLKENNPSVKSILKNTANLEGVYRVNYNKERHAVKVYFDAKKVNREKIFDKLRSKNISFDVKPRQTLKLHKFNVRLN